MNLVSLVVLVSLVYLVFLVFLVIVVFGVASDMVSRVMCFGCSGYVFSFSGLCVLVFRDMVLVIRVIRVL